MSEIIKVAPGDALPPETLQRVAAAAKGCKIICFPTDTVYGLGSTGLIKAAARRIYQIKDRSTLKPLPILVCSTAEARKWAEWTPAAELLARAFWPGPLTLVLRPTADGRLLTFAEYQTIAIRVPGLPLLSALLQASGVPWVSTSANTAGKPALTEGAAVTEQFKDQVDFIIDAGSCPGGVESTLVDASGEPVRIVREGAVPSAAILAALKQDA
ncbi:MAG: L-threonylcarbamoyladenylate synthase [Elusimicrobiota bacterium]